MFTKYPTDEAAKLALLPLYRNKEYDAPSGIVRVVDQYYPNRTAILSSQLTGTMFANYITVVVAVDGKDPGFGSPVEMAVVTMSNDGKELCFYEIVRCGDGTFAVQDAGTERSYVDGGMFDPIDYLNNHYGPHNMDSCALISWRVVFDQFFAKYDVGAKYLKYHIGIQQDVLKQHVKG